MNTTVGQKRITTGVVARVGVLGAIAAILFYIPGIPIIGFYKLEFSALPALLGGFAMGPWAALAITFIKDVTGLLHSSSAFVGELADFLCSSAFVVVASLWYGRHKTYKGALAGMAMGVLALALMGALANYFILIPFYINQMNFAEAAIIGMMAKVIPAIDSMFKVILMATVPFNLLKGVVVSVITLLLYKRLSPFLHGRKAG